MEERTACSSKSVSVRLEQCCGAELSWRLAPPGDLLRVPRLTADYSGPVASPAVDAIEISRTAFTLHPLERSLEHVLAIRGGKVLDVMLARCIAIWADWIPLDCYSSSHNCFYLETRLGLPRQFLGPALICTVSSPWKSTQAHLEMSLVWLAQGATRAVSIVWLSFVIYLCVCFCSLLFMLANGPYGHFEIKNLI